MKLLLLFSLIALPLTAKTFTDDQGRTIEAEIVGVRSDKVVLSRNGKSAQWPISKLSKGDQLYVKAWQKNPKKTPKVSITIWERDGVGPEGAYEKSNKPGLPKNIPGLIETTETTKYKHYEVDMTNIHSVDASQLTLAYVIYVIGGNGTVQELPASTAIESIPATKRVREHTHGATFVRTKTKLTTFSLNRGNLSTGKDRNVSKERFGGAWVRLYAQDGTLVGENQRLHPEIQNLKLTWNGPKNDDHIPVMSTFDQLINLLKDLPKPPGAPNLPLPKKPKDLPRLPGFPLR